MRGPPNPRPKCKPRLYPFTPDYDSYSTRPKHTARSDYMEWIEYANHLETMCKLHEKRIIELEKKREQDSD